MNNNMNNHRNDPQYEERKRAYYEQKRREEAERARKKKQMPYYIAVVALTLLIVICIGAAIVTNALFGGAGANSTYTVKIGNDKSEATSVDGSIMINLDKLMTLLELQKTGSATKPKYTSRAGDSIEFTDGKYIAEITVSGTTVPTNITMHTAATVNSDNGCMISLDTLSAIFSGITVTVDGSDLKIERKTVTGSADKLEPVSILNKSTEPLSRVLYLTGNMKEYEQYLNPADRDAYLILVNKQNPIDKDYTPENLVELDASIKNGNIPCGMMRLYAAKAIEAMLLDIEADYKTTYPDRESPIKAQSGYRTYQYQNNLFEGYIAAERRDNPDLSYDQAKELVLRYSALPDCSEHRTGLCIDLIDTRVGDLVNPFTQTSYYMEWLDENAWKYGFILRYPENTDEKNYEEITGYSYESWHFRYVGRYHAERISAAGITLEEYLETLN